MAALPSVWEAACKWRMDHTTGNRIAPQQARSTKINISFHTAYRAVPASDSSITIVATFARIWDRNAQMNNGQRTIVTGGKPRNSVNREFDRNKRTTTWMKCLYQRGYIRQKYSPRSEWDGQTEIRGPDTSSLISQLTWSVKMKMTSNFYINWTMYWLAK